MAPSDDLRSELARRKSHEAALQEFFEQHPCEWFKPNEGIERAGGRYAWRSRLPRVRKRIAGVIEWNKVNGPGTAYRFLPWVPVAPPADEYRDAPSYHDQSLF